MVLDRAIWIAIVLFAVSIIFSTAIVQSMVGVLAVVWIAKAVIEKRVGFRSTPLDIPFVVFLCARVVSILLSSNVATSISAMYVEVVFFSVFFLVTQLFDVTNARRVEILMKALFASAVIASVIGISKYALGFVPRASSTTSGYYTLGNYLCVILAIGLLLGKQRSFFSSRWNWFAFCIIVCAGIAFTFNRLHWAAAGLLIIVFGILKERWLVVLLLIGAISVVTLSPNVAERFSDLLHVFSRFTGRDVLWKGAFMIGGEHPVFGFGPRTFNEIFPLRHELVDKGVASWHNDYLQVYMESGLVGLVTLVWLLGSTFYFGIRTLRFATMPEHLRQLLAGLLLAIAMLAVVGGMLDLLVSFLFRLILALIALIVTAYPPKIAPGEKLT